MEARLESPPFVAFIARRGGQQEAEVAPPGERRRSGEALDLAPLAPRTALADEEIGVAGVDDEVVVVCPDGIEDRPRQLISRQARVLQGDVRAPGVHVAVSGIEHVEGGLHASFVGKGDLRGQLRHDLVERGTRRRQGLGCSLGRDRRRLVIQAGEPKRRAASR